MTHAAGIAARSPGASGVCVRSDSLHSFLAESVVNVQATLVLLPGDGIGPEIVAQAQRVLQAVAERYEHQFEFSSHLIGGCAIDQTGVPSAAGDRRRLQGVGCRLAGCRGRTQVG